MNNKRKIICAICLSVCILSACSSNIEPSVVSSTPDYLVQLPPPVESEAYWFSTQYGWFDRSHIGFGNPVSVLEQVRNAAKNEGGTVLVEAEVSGHKTRIGFKIEYEVEAIKEADVEAVMIGILQDATREFEWWQLSIAKPGPPLPEDIRSYSTWFANEDLPSNHLGFIAAILVEQYNQAHQENNSFDEFYRRILASFEAEPRPNGEEEKPWSYDVAEPARNYEFTFWVPDDQGGYNRVEWPTEYRFSVAGQASGLWRRGQAQMWDKNSDGTIIDWPFEEGHEQPAFYDPRDYQERFGVVEFCKTNPQFCTSSKETAN
ncbi:MAG: hypothetical protein AAF485_13275 [Chloroflexota bacterium]